MNWTPVKSPLHPPAILSGGQPSMGPGGFARAMDDLTKRQLSQTLGASFVDFYVSAFTDAHTLHRDQGK